MQVVLLFYMKQKERLAPLLAPATPFQRASETKTQKRDMHWPQSNSTNVCQFYLQKKVKAH